MTAISTTPMKCRLTVALFVCLVGLTSCDPSTSPGDAGPTTTRSPTIAERLDGAFACSEVFFVLGPEVVAERYDLPSRTFNPEQVAAAWAEALFKDAAEERACSAALRSAQALYADAQTK